MYQLPYTIAEGFAAKRGIAKKVFLRKILPQMTQKERMRLEKTLHREAVKSPKLDLQNLSLDRLTQLWLSYSIKDRKERLNEYRQAFDGVVARLLASRKTKLGRVAAILDTSWSTKGSVEKKNRTLGVSLGVSRILAAYSTAYLPLWTTSFRNELLCFPKGQTDIAAPLLKALRWKADLIIIVSDGYENAPSGAADEIMRLYRMKISKEPRVLHLNPVFDPQEYAPKPLGAHITTVGLRDAADTIVLLDMVFRILKQSNIHTLHTLLQNRAKQFIQRGNEHEKIDSSS